MGSEQTPGGNVGDLPLADDAVRLLAEARVESDRLHHEYLGAEHLVLALTRRAGDPATAPLAPLGVDGDRVRQTLAATLPAGHGALAPGAERPVTSRTRSALALAAESARAIGHPRVGTGHVLVGVLREGRNIGAQVLQHHGLTAVAAAAHARRHAPPAHGERN
jgi:ATP-dependent Clp protease ATP-binding subunit ClpC